MRHVKKVQKRLTTAMNALADFTGKPIVFAAILIATGAWFVVGLFMEYDLWFDIIDIFIFITTFWLLFIVQSSQNADTAAMQDKLDAILDALPGADKQKEEEEKELKRGEKELP